MGTPEPGDLCEGCGDPNGWMLLHPKYAYVCGVCEENGDAEFCEGADVLRRVVKCRGCENYGPINYEGDQRYCGGSPWCCP